ncbi:MAG: 3-deoxy-7-phosphoheptulonate synthase [Desulfarculaceae bacterium]|nr:3-deoxy-7-phosphoheptulonate synthase [Desulfarculaceae bacterium]MCF8046948.1 3-deoxy-7-phosphoheptulonate synthase [Desulfarculaceae bacterium]MCF8064868.1 3-deoxy-7-phosphoheptulonate synthase [Desulfarculaceae bacterium]MCF8124247.1 3-deoxy-7-phosphoheptulonate synthase [Desulfarculaceae bacterium]
MVITMQPGCPKSDVAKVISVLRQAGLEPRIISPDPRVVLGVVEEISPAEAERLGNEVGGLSGVEEITNFEKSWKLVSKSFKPETTQVQLGSMTVGGPEVMVAAGPCAVESRENFLETAGLLHRAGAGALRGGAFKPRTSPYSFRGMGEEGLKIMAEARDITGLPIITEVLTASEVELVARYADVLQIGTRNMQNFALLEAVGETDRPVLLKRGMMASIKELLLSAEYILARGNWQVMLCERGIRTFETKTRNTLDLSAVPLLKQYTHLPVVVDPSHAAGKRELVPALALAAVAAGADGILVEVHPTPEKALSDGRQSLRPEQFSDMMADLRKVAAAVGRKVREIGE